MPVPDFQTLMLPALRVLGQLSPRLTTDVRQALAKEFGLSEQELAELLPSGRQTTFANRVAWAYSYLKQAALITSPRRGSYDISSRGRTILAEEPKRIDISFLSRFPEFQAFRQPSVGVDAREQSTGLPSAPELTPDEQIRAGYKRLREALAVHLLDRMKTIAPATFEQLVIDVLVGLGYGGTLADAGRVVATKALTESSRKTGSVSTPSMYKPNGGKALSDALRFSALLVHCRGSVHARASLLRHQRSPLMPWPMRRTCKSPLC